MKTDLSVFRCNVAPVYCQGALSGDFQLSLGFIHAPLYRRRAALLHPRASNMQPSLEMSLRSKALPSAITLKVWWAFIFLSIHERWSDSCAGSDQIFYFMSEDMKIHQSKITSCSPLALAMINIGLSVWYTDRKKPSVMFSLVYNEVQLSRAPNSFCLMSLFRSLTVRIADFSLIIRPGSIRIIC